MASSNRPNRRPAAGSRTPTSRPRKVAGRSLPPQVDSSDPAEPPREKKATTPPSAPIVPSVRTTPPVARASRRSTPILVAAVVALLLIIVAEAVYLFGPPADEPIVSTARPVVASEVDRSTAVETAAESVERIVARSYETYDEQVEAATATMTETFAQEYRSTTDEIKDSFIEAKTEVTVTVVAQSVMSASSKQARVLLFLNQFVTKDGGEALYSPYRAVATMEKTDRGWLMSKLETR